MFRLFLPLLLTGALFAEDGGNRTGNMMQTFLLIAIAILFFYFILWRPEQKRRKQLAEQRSSLKTGDKVTAMGIIGRVEEIKENTVILKMVDGTSKIEILSAAITDVEKPLEERKS